MERDIQLITSLLSEGYNDESGISMLAILCELLAMPLPENRFLSRFATPSTLRALTDCLPKDSTSDKREIWRKVHNIFRAEEKKSGEDYFLYRPLAHTGRYPNRTLSRKGNEYCILSGCPGILTKNFHHAEKKHLASSELTHITRQEVRLLTSISLLEPECYSGLHLYDAEPIKIDARIVKGLRPLDLHYFILEYVAFWNRVRQTLPERSVQYDSGKFTFYPLDYDQEHLFGKIFDSFSIVDHLLLRTAYYLLRGVSLFRHPLFGEDAVANCQFAIEGMLYLIQRKNGCQHQKFDGAFLRKYFESHALDGGSLFEFLKEGHDKRTAIVHPSPRWGTQWSPTLFIDDFLDYVSAAKKLLLHILIDAPLDDP